MIFILMKMAGDEFVEGANTEAWINAIDRGALWHINDMVYNLFTTVEGEVRHHFTLKCTGQVEVNKLMEAILTSEDVLFQWSLISAESDDISSLVLQRIVKLYMTVRGFAFASSCLELYKQAHKKTLQKRRALRSEICRSD